MLDENTVPNGVGTGRPPAKFLPPAHGVTGIAIAERRKLAAALDQSGIETLFRGRIDCGDRRPPGDCNSSRCAANKQHSHDAPDDP